MVRSAIGYLLQLPPVYIDGTLNTDRYKSIKVHVSILYLSPLKHYFTTIMPRETLFYQDNARLRVLGSVWTLLNAENVQQVLWPADSRSLEQKPSDLWLPSDGFATTRRSRLLTNCSVLLKLRRQLYLYLLSHPCTI